jgi:hypothetical protein
LFSSLRCATLFGSSNAIAYARKHGAKLLDAYPVDSPSRSKDEYLWFGAKSMYDKAGFFEVARRNRSDQWFA